MRFVLCMVDNPQLITPRYSRGEYWSMFSRESELMPPMENMQNNFKKQITKALFLI